MAKEHVEPADCILWQFHQRSWEELSESSCKELIASMRRHGQRHPALGRRVEGDRRSSTAQVLSISYPISARKRSIKSLASR